MESNALTVIDIRQQTMGISSGYANFPVAQVNDHVVRVSLMTESYYWHLHPNSDETFLVMEGTLLIDLEDTIITLQPGQFFTIPKNVKHRTRPAGSRTVNCTFELQQMETISLE